MRAIVTRAELAQLLEDWRDGRLSMPDVHLWAEERYAVSSFEPEDEVVNEILSILDMLHIDALSRSDAAALREILARVGTDAKHANDAWAAHLSHRDR